MKKAETVQLLAMLSAYYGQGKADAKTMANAWHILLKDYPYIVAERAVIKYVKSDKRDYASFPPPGAVIAVIEAENKILNGVRNKALKKVSYDELSSDAKAWVTEPLYEWMLEQDEEKMTNHFEAIKEQIWGKHKPMMIQEKQA